ncbi:MAG: mechanosensitive ion channel [Bdellovibrionota bacterium]
MEFFKQSGLMNNIIGSIILIALLFSFRILALRTIQKWKFPSNEIRRKWIVQSRNATIVFLLFGLLFIWASELKEFAVSIVAFAVALVIATKEMILCMLGGFLKYSGNLFSIGDRVEIGEVRGDVINHNFFVTTIYEIGPGQKMHQFTGRIVVVPNSLFLSTPVINETETGQFGLHVFRVPFSRNTNWQIEASKLLEIAKHECSEYLKQARSEFEKLSKREGLEIHKIEPRIQIHYYDEKRVDVVLRIPVPARAKGRVEQSVLMKYSGLQP